MVESNHGRTPAGIEALPRGSRLIHIGPHKTGSSAVQHALDRARAELARHGVHYAGDSHRPQRAGWSIGLPGKRAGIPRPPESFWHALVAEIAGVGDATVCVSNEDFSRAGPEQRQRIVTELGQGRHHVLAAARPLHTFLPSLWQERVKAGVTLGWEEWLRIVLERGPGLPFHFERANVWRAHDVAGLIKRWSAVAGPHHLTVVVQDGRDHLLMPRTIERLLGLPEDLLDPPADGSNRGLAWSEVEALRTFHLAFDREGFDRRGRDPWMSRGAVAALTAALDLPPTGPRDPRSRRGPPNDCVGWEPPALRRCSMPASGWSAIRTPCSPPATWPSRTTWRHPRSPRTPSDSSPTRSWPP